MSSKGSDIYLWVICLGATLGGLLFGYDVVVVSGVIPQVLKQFELTSLELGLLVSCVLWGCAIGSGCAGIILDIFGRKKILIASSATMFVSALWCGFAESTTLLIAARFLGGVGCGLASTACPLYLSEVSPEHTRGRMVTLYHFSVCLGIVICVFMNWGIFLFAEANTLTEHLYPMLRWLAVEEYWRAMFISEAIPAFMFIVSSVLLPESPRWLVKNARIVDAEAILTRINGTGKARLICEEIKTIVHLEKQIKFIHLFTARLRKPFTLSILLCVFSEACGISAVLYYGPHLFEQAGLSLGESLGGFTVIVLVLLVFNLVAMYYIDTIGRKKLLTIGTIGALVSLLIIGICYFSGLKGFTIVFVMTAFVAFFASSIGPVKFVVLSEIFPNLIRGKAISVGTVCIWLTSAAIAQLFPMMRELFDTGYIFFFFALDLSALLLVVMFLMPETRGRTIEEIEASWLSSNH